MIRMMLAGLLGFGMMMSVPAKAQNAGDTAAAKQQLKDQAKTDKDQSKADKTQAKALSVHKQRKADKKQAKADNQAAKTGTIPPPR